jgi:hypothetical protein
MSLDDVEKYYRKNRAKADYLKFMRWKEKKWSSNRREVVICDINIKQQERV